MPTKKMSTKRIARLDRAIKKSFDTRLKFFEDINGELPILLENARGFAEGRDEPQYNLSKDQYKAILDMVKFQQDFIKEREKFKDLFSELDANAAYAERFKRSQSAGGIQLDRHLLPEETEADKVLNLNTPVVSFGGMTIDVKPH